MSEFKTLKNFPMEVATMHDMVACDILGSLVQSNVAANLPEGVNPIEAMVRMSMTFASEFLKQREALHNPPSKLDLPPEPKIVI
jgi:hypothetical protein